MKCTEDDIKMYANEKLAKFKIPKKIFFVNEIPKGATGKLQRNTLAKKFGLVNWWLKFVYLELGLLVDLLLQV